MAHQTFVGSDNSLFTNHDFGRGIIVDDNENEEHNYTWSPNHDHGRSIFRDAIDQHKFAADTLDSWDEMRTGLSTVNTHDETPLSNSMTLRATLRNSHTQQKASVQQQPSPPMERNPRMGRSPQPPRLSSRRRHKVPTPSTESTVEMPTFVPPSSESHRISSSDVLVGKHDERNLQPLSWINGLPTIRHGRDPETKGIWTSYTISEDHTGGSEAISQLRLAALRRNEYSLIHFRETQRSDTDETASTNTTSVDAASLDLQPGHDLDEYGFPREPLPHPQSEPQDNNFHLDFSQLDSADVLENFDFDSFLNSSKDDGWDVSYQYDQ